MFKRVVRSLATRGPMRFLLENIFVGFKVKQLQIDTSELKDQNSKLERMNAANGEKLLEFDHYKSMSDENGLLKTKLERYYPNGIVNIVFVISAMQPSLGYKTFLQSN